MQKCTYGRLILLGSLLAVLLTASKASAHKEPASQAPRPSRAEQVLGFVGSGKNVVLTRLDARTLAPLREATRLHLGIRAEIYAFTPDRSRLAVVDSLGGALIIDPVRLRVVRRLTRSGYRFGPSIEPFDVAWAGKSSLIIVGSCQCGALAYLWIGLPGSPGGAGVGTEIDTYAPIETWEQTREGLAALVNGQRYLDLLDEWGRIALALDGLPASREIALAVDGASDRVFVVSRVGTVAAVGRISTRKPTLSYHDVQLASPTGEWSTTGAASLDSRTFAVWGSDGVSATRSPLPAGLTFVDTRGWSTRVVDAAISNAVVAQAGASVVGWTAGAPTGVSFFGRGGHRRFGVLAGHQVRWVDASGNYAYVSADCVATRLGSCSRFSVDLRSGRVTGPLRTRARPLAP
jgi:hypothetical protein